MLKIINIENRTQLDALFESYNSNVSTWVVSDLRSKFELQGKLIEKNGSYIDDSILRASDLWKVILKRAQPQLRIVSDAFIKTMIRHVLSSNQNLLEGLSSSSAESVYAYIEQMASIVFHPKGAQNLEEWFDEHPESANKWKSWYLVARFVVLHLLEEHKLISQRWIAAVLQNNISIEKFWSKPLIVDLSGAMTKTEAELIRQLSRFIDVTVIAPDPKWKSEFAYLMQPYDYLNSESQSKQKLSFDELNQKEVSFFKASSMFSEVKLAVSSVRQWLDQGVHPKSIVIAAPDIEVYWPSLQTLLEMEGVPVNKAVTGKLQSIPSIVKWLAELRIRSGVLSSTDLELSFYQDKDALKLRFEKFKALFNSLYSESDFKRSEVLEKIFEKKYSGKASVSRDEFIVESILYWHGDSTEHLQTILREMISNASEKVQLVWSDWLSYLESIVASKEWTIQYPIEDGIAVTRLASSGSSTFTHRVFLGLVEEQIRSKSKLQLSYQEYFELSKDLGFVLYNPDFSDLDFELRWISESISKVDIYSVGLADFSGKLQSPIRFWIASANNGSQSDAHTVGISIPEATRYDELQRREIVTHPRVLTDLGKMQESAIDLKNKLSMSPSSMKEYFKCPFVFAAGRVFKLEDHPDVELEIDARTKGNLAHFMFEKLGAEPIRFEWSDEEIIEVLESGRREKELVFAAEEFWVPIRSKYLALGRKFLEFEKDLRIRFPKLKTVAAEYSVKAWFDPESGTFSHNESPGKILVSGRIDRVDSSGEQVIVFDYKASHASAPSVSKWIEDKELQMPFYLWALSHSNNEMIKGSVDAALYYIYKDFKFKGFVVNERAGEIYEVLKSSTRSKVENNDESKKWLMEQFEIEAGSIIKNVANGIFAPVPEDKEKCSSCKWRRLCRAPHLN